MRPLRLLSLVLAGLLATTALLALPAAAYAPPDCIQPCCPITGCLPSLVRASCLVSLSFWSLESDCRVQGIGGEQSHSWCPYLGPNVECADGEILTCHVAYPQVTSASC